jgi:hypothetical protein
MNGKEFIHSSAFQGLLVGVGAVVAVLIVFEAGVQVGRHQASFAAHEGDAYYRVFMHRADGPFGIFMHTGDASEHGASGKVVSVALPTFIVADPQNVEKTIVVDDDTIIRRLDGDVTPDDIQVGDFAVVLGAPDPDSRIDAKFIRLLPPPPIMTSQSQ